MDDYLSVGEELLDRLYDRVIAMDAGQPMEAGGRLLAYTYAPLKSVGGGASASVDAPLINIRIGEASRLNNGQDIIHMSAPVFVTAKYAIDEAASVSLADYQVQAVQRRMAEDVRVSYGQVWEALCAPFQNRSDLCRPVELEFVRELQVGKSGTAHEVFVTLEFRVSWKDTFF